MVYNIKVLCLHTHYLLTPWSRVLEKLTGFAANQEIPRILWNPKVHYRTDKRLPLHTSFCISIQFNTKGQIRITKKSTYKTNYRDQAPPQQHEEGVRVP